MNPHDLIPLASVLSLVFAVYGCIVVMGRKWE
jgi:hypothetical protein